jgi:hypothetical protein
MQLWGLKSKNAEECPILKLCHPAMHIQFWGSLQNVSNGFKLCIGIPYVTWGGGGGVANNSKLFSTQFHATLEMKWGHAKYVCIEARFQMW